MNCVHCYLPVLDGTKDDVMVNAATVVYNGESLCLPHFFDAVQGELEGSDRG